MNLDPFISKIPEAFVRNPELLAYFRDLQFFLEVLSNTVIDRRRFVTVVDTAYTVQNEAFLFVDDDTAGGAVTVTLPPVSGQVGRLIAVKKLGTTGNVVIDGNGAETIDGSATLVNSTQYASYSLYCNGTEWLIV